MKHAFITKVIFLFANSLKSSDHITILIKVILGLPNSLPTFGKSTSFRISISFIFTYVKESTLLLIIIVINFLTIFSVSTILFSGFRSFSDSCCRRVFKLSLFVSVRNERPFLIIVLNIFNTIISVFQNRGDIITNLSPNRFNGICNCLTVLVDRSNCFTKQFINIVETCI